MVSSDTVIPINNGFYTVDKLNAKQHIYGAEGLTFLERIEYSREYGIIVGTDHFEITVSPEQYFLTADGPVKASEIKIGHLLMTDADYSEVTSVSNTEQIYDMFFLATKDGTFQANGFYLTNNG